MIGGLSLSADEVVAELSDDTSPIATNGGSVREKLSKMGMDRNDAGRKDISADLRELINNAASLQAGLDLAARAMAFRGR